MDKIRPCKCGEGAEEPEQEEKGITETVGSSEDTKSDDSPCTKEKLTPLVLEPDHPMMERFQRALKRHLERLREKVTEDVLELDNTLKMKEKEKEMIGVELYTMQQELFRQQTTLEKYGDTMDELMKERENLDEILKTRKLKWKEEVDKLNNEKKNEQELSTELYKLSSMEVQMSKWEKEMDDSLAISQRISEKTKADKNKIIEEKRKTDMHMLRLMTEVTKFESEIKLMDAELQIKWDEKSVLHQTLSDANADLQALIDEQKSLCSAWNMVVNVMSKKDKVFANVSQELKECQQAFKTLNTEIENYKKSSAEAMRENERLSIIYGRIFSDKENYDVQINQLLEKKGQLEYKMGLLASSISEGERNLEICSLEMEQVWSQFREKLQEYNKYSKERQTIEDKCLIMLHDQLANDKTSLVVNKMVKELREKLREKEFGLINLENTISKRFLEVEQLKGTMTRNNAILESMNEELDRKEQELKFTENEINKCHLAILQKQASYAVLLKKIEKQAEKMGSIKPGQHPLQLRITELEKSISELQEKNEKVQSYWLLQQNNNVKLTNQRNEQVKEIHLLRKQITVLEQRTLKTELEIEKEQKIESEVNKSIAALQNKMLALNKKLSGRKDCTQSLDKENNLMQCNFLQALKESELEQIRLKAEISELETSLEELAELMLENQREMLTWERRIKMAIETKENIMKERSESGEIGQMKTEIHRMEIRYDQLKKAQEKIVSDLELCILRRDAVVETSEAREKRQAQGFNTRYMLQKKLDNLKNRIRSLQNERCDIEKNIDRIKQGQEDLQNQIQKTEEKLKTMEEKTKKLDSQLEDGKLCKQQNLEMLVRRQKKCKLYNQVKLGKHRLLHKNELELDNSMQNARSLNSNLISISESLLEDFPGHRFQIMKILNTTKAESS